MRSAILCQTRRHLLTRPDPLAATRPRIPIPKAMAALRRIDADVRFILRILAEEES